MPINLGTDWEQAVLELPSVHPSGITGGDIDPGSMEVASLNASGASTVRCTLVLTVDTEELRQSILDHLAVVGD